MREIIFQIREDDVDGGFIAQALGVGITTQAETESELRKMIEDALRCHFDDDTERPKIIHLHFVKDEVMTIA